MADQKETELDLHYVDQQLKDILKKYPDAKNFPNSKKLVAEVVARVRKNKRKKVCKVVAVLVLILAVLTPLVWSETLRWSMSSYFRLLMLRILPVWDWTQYYSSDCLMDNPYYVGHQLQDVDCEICKGLDSIPRLSSVSPSDVAENFLKEDKPIIVVDATDQWPARRLFKISFLSQLHHSEDSLVKYAPCQYKTNIKNVNAKTVLKQAAEHQVTNFYAHWEHCERQAAKFIREFFERPYFLPAMVEMADTNWLFVASDYQGKMYKPVDLGFPMMFISVIQGQMKVSLTPRQPCNSHCRILYATLGAGDTIVFTDLLWFFDYLPVGRGETIALGAGGYFD